MITDRAGERYGRLAVVAFSGLDAYGRSLWDCLCECGRSKVVPGGHLRSGHTRSCGCLLTEVARRPVRHGHGRGQRNGGVTAEYGAWRNMKTRCLNPRSSDFANYGGRGITVCARWRAGFEYFLADMGPRPSSGHTLDRIDNDGPYEPGNCRWATQREQGNNKRTNRHVTIDGRRLTISEAARTYAIDRRSLTEVARPGRGRFIYHGLTVEVA